MVRFLWLACRFGGEGGGSAFDAFSEIYLHKYSRVHKTVHKTCECLSEIAEFEWRLNYRTVNASSRGGIEPTYLWDSAIHETEFYVQSTILTSLKFSKAYSNLEAVYSLERSTRSVGSWRWAFYLLQKCLDAQNNGPSTHLTAPSHTFGREDLISRAWRYLAVAHKLVLEENDSPRSFN